MVFCGGSGFDDRTSGVLLSFEHSVIIYRRISGVIL